MNKMSNLWTARVLTLFPEMFPGPLAHSLAGKALQEGIWALETFDIRSFAKNRHQVVDDTPFGGGAGMVMRADVIDRGLNHISKLVPNKNVPILYLTPRGSPLTQAKVRDLSGGRGIVVVCGRYEGIDERAVDVWNMEEVSLGDYILSGGEPAAISLIDASVRLLPGVMGSNLSKIEETFEKEHAVSQGRSYFNDGRFWECHEVLEGVWKQIDGDEKKLVNGLILVAAGLVHYQKDEDDTCISIFSRALNKLETSNGIYHGIDVDRVKSLVQDMIKTKKISTFEI